MKKALELIQQLIPANLNVSRLLNIALRALVVLLLIHLISYGVDQIKLLEAKLSTSSRLPGGL